ncbi:uncharacterized protein [Oscarella lobularis]|uniref:uncharacterized protein isoform X2 n=1 Tax=Oscarella lobularis TaxID=121494 RepID=UPI0033135F6B
MLCSSPQRSSYFSIAICLAAATAFAVSPTESFSEAVENAENETRCFGYCIPEYKHNSLMKRRCLSLCQKPRIFRNESFCRETCEYAQLQTSEDFEGDCKESCLFLGTFPQNANDDFIVMKFAEVNGSFLRWDSNNDHAWFTPLYAVVGESDWHPLFPLHGKYINLEELLDNGYLRCNTSYLFQIGPFQRKGPRGKYAMAKDPYRTKCSKTWNTRCHAKEECIPDQCRNFSHSVRVDLIRDDVSNRSSWVEWDDEDCSDVRARKRIAWNVTRQIKGNVCLMLHAKAKSNCYHFFDRWYPLPQDVNEFWLDDLLPGCKITVEMHALVENETFVFDRKDDVSVTFHVPHLGSDRCNRFDYSLKFLESQVDGRLVPLAIKFKIRRDMVLRISASDGSFNDTKMRTTDNLHWSWQPLCARINVTFFVRHLTKRLLLIDWNVTHSPPTSQAETKKDDTGDAASSDFPLVIVVSVGVSVLVVVLIVVFAVVYVRLEKRRYSTAAEKRMQLPDYRPPMALPLFDPTSEPPDEWEIRPEDLRLLDVMGKGFFGVVLRAEVSHRAEAPLMTQKRLSMKLRRDPSMRRRSSTSRKIRTLVACKMLKEKGTYEDQMELLEEIKLMKRIGQHEHVVSMIACITKSHPVCLIVEYCSHGDLSSYLKKGRGHCFSEKRKQSIACDHEDYILRMRRPSHSYADIRGKVNEDERHVKFTSLDLLSFVWQIASGMEYLSGKGLVHRDLACRNVLVVDEKLLKVSDFGLTRAVHQDGIYPQKTTRRLPLRWMSVEAIADRLFTEQSDVWSFGVVMWEICTLGSFPYSSVSTKDLLSHLRTGGRLERPDNCSEELYDMMSKCWCTEPESRPAFSLLAKNLGKLLEEEQPTRYLQLDFSSSCKMWDLELAGTELGEMEADAGKDAIVSGAATIMMQEVPGSNDDADDS